MKGTALFLLAGVCLGGTGCIAEIHEERLFEAPHTLAASRSETLEQRESPDDDAPGGACREITITYPVVRDVTVRRYFADDAQTRNLALTTLLGAGIALLAYGANQSSCSPTGACRDFAGVRTAEVSLLALAAIPIGFIGYNAIRVQDGRTFEYVTPTWTPGARVPCRNREPRGDGKTATE
jgi:hypothetical protein